MDLRETTLLSALILVIAFPLYLSSPEALSVDEYRLSKGKEKFWIQLQMV